MASASETVARVPAPTGRQRVFRFARRWPVIPVLIILSLIVVGTCAQWIAPHDPLRGQLLTRNNPPFWYEEGSTKNILGADTAGRDVLSRVIYGARISLLVAAVSLTAGMVVGTAVGLLSGYVGGFIDDALMRVVDVWLGLPFILLALVIVVVLGQSLATLLGVLAFLTWAGFVRNVRGEVLSLKTRDYVVMAKISGASPQIIILKHILPGVVNTVIVLATLRVGGLILAEATLSFLGAGVPPPTPTWGGMVSDGRNYLESAWWISVFPGLAIFLVVMGFNFLGDWLRDYFDPRLRQQT